MTTTKKQSMQLALQKVRAGAVRHVPILSWARSYPAAWLRPDLISAATGWGLMVPVAIAYAEMAGVPAEVGLYTAFAGLLGYAIFAYEPPSQGHDQLDHGDHVRRGGGAAGCRRSDGLWCDDRRAGADRGHLPGRRPAS